MALSVPNSNGGTGLSGLLRQTRQAKADDAAAAAAGEQPTPVPMRPVGRAGIDSTQRGTAQITAALTVYLSKLGGAEDEPARVTAVKPSQPSLAAAATGRSGAADLLRTLDGYRATGGMRLSA